MNANNPLYKNQGMHVVIALFCVIDNKPHILLINRTNEPFTNFNALPSGAVYNNETIECAVQRELKEKTGIDTNLYLENFGIFSDPQRAKETGFRMFGIGYIGLVNSEKLSLLEKGEKYDEIFWCEIDKIPTLAYDHNMIAIQALNYLKNIIFEKNIVKYIMPKEVTIPQIQKVYESILQTKLDRRNFSKRILNSKLIVKTDNILKTAGKKASFLYKFV